MGAFSKPLVNDNEKKWTNALITYFNIKSRLRDSISLNPRKRNSQIPERAFIIAGSCVQCVYTRVCFCEWLCVWAIESNASRTFERLNRMRARRALPHEMAHLVHKLGQHFPFLLLSIMEVDNDQKKKKAPQQPTNYRVKIAHPAVSASIIRARWNQFSSTRKHWRHITNSE